MIRKQVTTGASGERAWTWQDRGNEDACENVVDALLLVVWCSRQDGLSQPLREDKHDGYTRCTWVCTGRTCERRTKETITQHEKGKEAWANTARAHARGTLRDGAGAQT